MGTKLTDAKFFGELLDTTRPGLENIPALAAKEDYAACRRVFAAHVREMLQPETYFSIFSLAFYDQCPELAGVPADKAVKNIVSSCGIEWDFGEGPIDWFLNPTYNGYPEWTWQLSRHPEWRTLARAYRETGDEIYAEAAARQIQSWIDQAQAPEPCSGGATLCWRTIECGIRMGQCWQEVIHTFLNAPAFTDDLLTDWCKSIWEHGERLRRDHMTGNWLIMEMNGLTHIGLLYPCFKTAAEWLDYGVKKLKEELFVQVYEDGWQYELSTNYQDVVITNYVSVMRIFKAYGLALDPDIVACIEKLLSTYVKMMRPDGRVPDINDGRPMAVADLAREYSDICGNDPIVRWGATGGKEGTQPEATQIFKNAGLAALRTGWGKDDTYLFFDGGEFGYGHQHEDKLHVMLSAGEKNLLLDGNNYSYDASEMRTYVLSTRAHNTIRVDGMDQNRRKTYDRLAMDIEKVSGLQSKTGDAVDALRAVYDEGYGPEQDKSVTHERSVYFVKKAEGAKPFAVIVDRLTADRDHDYEVLWHMGGKTLVMDGLQLHTEDLHVLTPAAPMETAGLSISRGVQFPDWQGWEAKSMVQKDFVPVYTAQYWLHAKDIRWVTLLYPAADCPFIGVEASLDVNDTKFTLKKADGTALTVDETEFWK